MKFKTFNLGIILLLQFSVVMSAPLIENGIEDTLGLYDNVHKISFTTLGGTKSHCTGTVINDYTILSAGHCFAGFSLLHNSGLNIGESKFSIKTISIPTNFWESQFKLQNTIRDKNTLFYYQFNYVAEDYEKKMKILNSEITRLFLEVANVDISLVTTNEKIPKSLERTKLNFSKVDTGLKTISAGYGQLGYNSETNSTIYPSKLNYIDSTVVSSSNSLAVVGVISKSAVTTGGDSGGPLLIKETKEQIGILSGIGNIKLNIDDLETTKQSVYVPIRNLKKFILSNIIETDH